MDKQKAEKLLYDISLAENSLKRYEEELIKISEMLKKTHDVNYTLWVDDNRNSPKIAFPKEWIKTELKSLYNHYYDRGFATYKKLKELDSVNSRCDSFKKAYINNYTSHIKSFND